jgi:hypothetical protein
LKKLFEEGIVVSVIMVAVIVIVDLLVMKTDYYTLKWMSDLFKINLILIAIFPVIYFMLIHRDKSETIALFLTSFILWMTGLADVLYFWFQGKGIPWTLPWLNEHIVIGKISNLIGYTTVTSTTLFISVMIGFAVVIFIDVTLEKIN